MSKVFAPTIAVSLAFILAASVNAGPKVKPVEIVGPAMLPVDVVNTVGVEIVGPAMLPVDVANTVEVEIVGPAMIPVDVMNAVEIVGPMFFPKEIIDTMISADGQPGMIDVTQVIQEIVVLPSPNESAAVACRVHVSLNGVSIAHGSWNGDEYGSFPLSLPGPIDVVAQTVLMAQLTPLPVGGDGQCTADLAVLGTLIEPTE